MKWSMEKGPATTNDRFTFFPTASPSEQQTTRQRGSKYLEIGQIAQ